MSRYLYAWQVLEADRWGIISAFIPMIEMHGPLVARSEWIARRVFAPIALAHAEQTGFPIRLARYELAEVIHSQQ